eukprot:4062974-Amphidinium_carterae.1
MSGSASNRKSSQLLVLVSCPSSSLSKLSCFHPSCQDRPFLRPTLLFSSLEVLRYALVAIREVGFLSVLVRLILAPRASSSGTQMRPPCRCCAVSIRQSVTLETQSSSSLNLVLLSTLGGLGRQILL